MRCLVAFVAVWMLTTGCVAESPVLCGDASFWSERSADWPLDDVWIGEEPMELADAIDLLELPATDGRDALHRALVVAELNLAAGGSEATLSRVYAGHAWVSTDDGDPAVESEAAALAGALDEAVCP